MPLPLSRSRRIALLALAAFLLVASPTYGQDKPDAKSIIAKVKEGAGLTKIKEMLAASPAGARFRLDGFSLGADNKSIKVSGVMLVPGAKDEDRANAAKQTRNKVIEAVQKVAGAGKFEEFDFDSTVGTGSVKEVRGERLPHMLLQKAANKAGEKDPAADEIKLNDARFDTAGHLVLIGLRGSKPETEKWLTEAISTVLAENPAAIGPDGKRVDANGKPLVQTDKVEIFNKTGWPVSAAVIQKALIRKNIPALTRVRVDRVYFVSTPDKVEEANPTGISWAYALSGIAIGTEASDAKGIVGVCDEVFTAGFGEPMKNGDLEGLIKADYHVPDPAAKFQKAVAGVPALDGVRVDDRTEFGEDGRLVLTGLQPGLDEKGLKELSATILRVLAGLTGGSDGNALYRRLAIHGISEQKMERIKIRDLHAELRKWVSDRLDDVRLTRLYFNEEGRLTLICDTPPGDEKDRAAVEAELKTRLAIYKFPPPAKGAATPAKDTSSGSVSPAELKGGFTTFVSATQSPSQDPVVKPGPNPFKASLTRHLQTMVSDPEKKEWAAVLIERGYFDGNNRYTIRGVVDTPKQKEELTRYLKSLQNDPEWSAYFMEPVADLNLDVIPMAELVARVQRVTPAYPVFDGVRIIGAKYSFIKEDKSGFADGLNLVFTAHVVGRPNLYECRVMLADLISKHPSYSRRLAKSSNDRFPRLRIEEVPMPPPPASFLLAHFTNGFGALNLARADASGFPERLYYLVEAKKWIDAGLMHDPDQASIWFLSAYFHHITGDRELTRRDLYRMIEIEDPLSFNGGEQRRRRYDVAKDLQGVKRDELEKLWLQCWKEVKDGAKPITLVVPAK